MYGPGPVDARLHSLKYAYTPSSWNVSLGHRRRASVQANGSVNIRFGY